MTLYHVSYDAKESSDSKALRLDIPAALLKAERSVAALTEPVRSTFRFKAESGDEPRARILTAMAGFADRCYYFLSASDSYVRDGKVFYPSKTMANEELDKEFQKLLKARLEDSAGEDGND